MMTAQSGFHRDAHLWKLEVIYTLLFKSEYVLTALLKASYLKAGIYFRQK